MLKLDLENAAPLVECLGFYFELTSLELIIRQLELTTSRNRLNPDLCLMLGCLKVARDIKQATISEEKIAAQST